jgi:hypothetical protein
MGARGEGLDRWHPLAFNTVLLQDAANVKLRRVLRPQVVVPYVHRASWMCPKTCRRGRRAPVRRRGEGGGHPEGVGGVASLRSRMWWDGGCGVSRGWMLLSLVLGREAKTSTHKISVCGIRDTNAASINQL